MSRLKPEEKGTNPQDTGARVSEALASAGLTPTQAERKLHYSAGYLGKIARGERRLIPRVAALISSLTGVDAQWLETGERPPALPQSGSAPAPKGDATEEQAKYELPAGTGPRRAWRFCPHCGGKLPDAPEKGGGP